MTTQCSLIQINNTETSMQVKYLINHTKCGDGLIAIRALEGD